MKASRGALKLSMSVLREKRGISFLLFYGDNGGRKREESRLEVVKD